MDLIDQLKNLGERAAKQRDLLLTEEATKMALIAPFINALGYNVFDPTEVVPEFVADVGIKKGEKVDYAIRQGGKVIMIFECKGAKEDLNAAHASQLYRYFSVVEARIAVLTNGIVYRFFTDLDERNKLDEKPFLEINLLDIKEPLVEELKKLHRASFDLDKLIATASDLKYLSALKRIVAEEIANPSDELVKLLGKQVYQGTMTQGVRDQLRELLRRAFQQTISDRLASTLQVALDREVKISDDSTREVAKAAEVSEASKNAIVTTDEELEAFRIVRAIVREVVDVKRVAQRDVQSYFSVLLDDNNRKPICRLYFNAKTKYLGLFNPDKTEEKVVVEDVDDIFKYADRLKAVALSYDTKSA